MPAAPRYLLLQARNGDDPMREHEVSCFVRHMGVQRAQISVHDVLGGVPTRAQLDATDAVLIGGSGDYSSLDDLPWVRELIRFIRAELVLSGMPVFASCFGFQVIVLALGGVMVRDRARSEMGSYDLVLAEAARRDPIFSVLPERFVAQVGHNDRAEALPSGVVLYASSDLCPIHAFRVGRLPIWATQFHPELDRDDITHRYITYRAHYAPLAANTPIDEDPWIQRLRPSPDASLLLPRFDAWVRRHVALHRVDESGAFDPEPLA